MNILICVATYYPDKNGVQMVTQYQAEGLAMLGHNVTVITSNANNNKENNEMFNGVNIIRINAVTKNMKNYGNKEEYQKLLINQCSKNDIAIFVCPQSWSTDWAIEIVDKLKCKKLIMLHGMHEFNMSNVKLNVYSILRKIVGDIKWGIFYKKNINKIKKFNGFMHLHENDYSYKFFLKKKIENNYILYNAVNDDFFNNQEEKENIIINVGKYCKNKNQIQCLKSFYKSNLKNYRLILIGTPQNKYYDFLLKKKKAYDKKYGFRNVEIYVNIDREKTIEYIKKSKVYLLTSLSEKFPISIVEAMASKCAFVSTDVGIIKYLPGGIIVQKRRNLYKALNEIADSSQYEKYVEKAYNFATVNCRVSEQVKKLENIIENIYNE